MSHEELIAKAETDAADWLECVEEWRTEDEAHAEMMRATAMTMGELCAALRAETAACMRYLAQRDEARAERNAARERITACESALRQAAGCIAPEEMFQELGFYKVGGEWADDAAAHLEAKREVDAYFDRFPDAKERKT